MDKALKQRLVGASVLVALAVIILPMLLSGQAERKQESREIEIPPRPAELSFEKRRFPIGEQPTDSPSTVPEQAPGSEQPIAGDLVEAVEGEPPQRSLQERLEEVAAANEADNPQLPAEPVPGTGDATIVASEADVNDAQNGVSESERDGPADVAANPALAPETAEPEIEVVEETIVESGPEPASQLPEDTNPGGRYLVQVASFSSTGNANRLANSLRESGLPVLMDTVESAAGTLNRVRVGPFSQRAEADQVLARLRNQIPDVRPRLVDLRPDEESPVTEPEDALIRWVVQVGVFSGSENAEKLVFSLRDAGYRAISRAETADGSTRYRVLVGPEISRATAVTLADRLLAEQGIKGIVQSTE